MQLLIAAIADHANIALGDKLNLFGVFDNIHANAFPTRHPQLCVVLRVLYEYEDARSRTNQVEVVLVDQDGRESVRAVGQVNLPEIPAGKRLIQSHVLFFNDLVFAVPNEFAFLIRWNGQEVRRLPLTVGLVSPQQGAG